MSFSTADISDAHPDTTSVCQLQFRSFGLRAEFSGRCATLRVDEDHRPVMRALSMPSAGRVLVVDVAGSLRVAVFGDRLAELACRNGWAGVVVNGAIRDSAVVNTIDIGVRALGTTALRSRVEATASASDVPLEFGGVTFTPGAWIYCDADAVLTQSGTMRA